ncbi:MAG TPA: hypothetical protein PKA37_15285, partial [Planctomycetota bacterium]|nr:hypothetical protein [Planctomycetota bacterium]
CMAQPNYSFGGFNFNQDDAPDVFALLGNNQVLSGATFSAGFPTAATSTVGFPDAPTAGFDGTKTLGQILNPSSVRALNLPNGNNGTTTRHGVELAWSGGRALVNVPGTDIVVYESGSTGAPEALMVSVQSAATGTWSNWHFYTPTSFAVYTLGSDGAWVSEFDLSDMGIPANAAICGIRLANMVAADRINLVAATGEGEVVPGSGSASLALPDPGPLASSSTFSTGALDPDPLYVAVLGPVVNPVASLVPFGGNCGGIFAPTLTISSAIIGTTTNIDVTGAEPSSWGALFFGPVNVPSALPGAGCQFHLYNPGSTFLLFTTNGLGDFNLPVFLPNDPLLHNFPIGLQAIVFGASGLGATNAVGVLIGYK